MQVEVGKIYEGKVTGITNFGAFVEIGEGTTGLVHISEVALEYVKDIKEHLKVGQTVNVKVTNVDRSGKIGLSIKQAIKKEEAQTSRSPAEFVWDKKPAGDISFEEKLNKFKQASEEKMHDLKRSMEPKRGSNRKNY